MVDQTALEVEKVFAQKIEKDKKKNTFSYRYLQEMR